MSNSSLVQYKKLSPNHSGKRTHTIDRITPHCVVGQLTAESICDCFISPSRQASCNYGIGKDGKIALCVDESNRSWCSSSKENDQRAVTIECASDMTHPYSMNTAVWNSLVALCVDICKRNGKNTLRFIENKLTALTYTPKSNEMILTAHRWFSNTICPGDWLYSRFGRLADTVTQKLSNGVSTSTKVVLPSGAKTLYRAQIGAFTARSNADALVTKVKAAGFDACVVTVSGKYKVQAGAFVLKSNAEALVKKLEAKGFDAFVTTETESTTSDTEKKSVAEIAQEIYRGTCSDPRWQSWSSGETRVSRLQQAGYNPVLVQKEVNKLFGLN